MALRWMLEIVADLLCRIVTHTLTAHCTVLELEPRRILSDVMIYDYDQNAMYKRIGSFGC